MTYLVLLHMRQLETLHGWVFIQRVWIGHLWTAAAWVGVLWTIAPTVHKFWTLSSVARRLEITTVHHNQHYISNRQLPLNILE